MITFELEQFFISEEKHVLAHVEMYMTSSGSAPAMASLNYPGDPGEPPEYEVNEITLTHDNGTVLTLTETQFDAFFTNGADTINNALEWAAEQEVEHDY